MASVVDIKQEAAMAPWNLDALLNNLYYRGFLFSNATAPSGEELVGMFENQYGTSPAFLMIDDDTRTLSLHAIPSPTIDRAIRNGARELDVRRASMLYR